MSFESYYSLSQPTLIEIDQINNLKDDKLFVSIGGGVAVGKSFVTKKFVTLPVIDVDNCVTEANSGTYDKKKLSEGRKLFNERMQNAFEGEESFVHMGTNANLNGTKKRLMIAKENGFTTVLVLIEAPIETALKRARQRVDESIRNEIPIERVYESMLDSLRVFHKLNRNIELVDFFVNMKNI